MASSDSETIAMLQKQIAGYVLMPTDDEVLETALAGMRRAIDKMNAHRNWNCSLASDDIHFAEGKYDYALTSWFKAPRNFEIWNTNNETVGRLSYKPWKTFLSEHSYAVGKGTPCVYSSANPNEYHSVSLDISPDANFVSAYPMGKVWYFRHFMYPVHGSGDPLDCPSAFTLFVLEWACGYTADRHKIEKSADAYGRAREQLAALAKLDGKVYTDWT